MQVFLETERLVLRRFDEADVEALLELTELWASTVGLCAPEEDVRWMERALGSARAGEYAREVDAFSQPLGGLYQELRRAEGGDAARLRDQPGASVRRCGGWTTDSSRT